MANRSRTEGISAVILKVFERDGNLVFTRIKRAVRNNGFELAEISQKHKTIHIRRETNGVGYIDVFIEVEVIRRQIIVSAVTLVIIDATHRSVYLNYLNRYNQDLAFGGFFYIDDEGHLIYRSTFFYITKYYLSEEILGMHIIGALHEAEEMLDILSENRSDVTNESY